MRLKAKEIYSHITKDQENVKLFSTSAGWLGYFKRQYSMKNAKLAGEASSTSQETVQESLKYLLNFI